MPDEEKELDVVPDGDDLIAPPPLHALLPPPAISRTGSANTHVLIEGEPCVTRATFARVRECATGGAGCADQDARKSGEMTVDLLEAPIPFPPRQHCPP
jgi:hypothetical protein